MSDAPTIKLQRQRVVLGDEEDSATWTVFTITPRIKDVTMARSLGRKHPEWGDDQIMTGIAIAWYALRRRGLYGGKFDEFHEDLIALEEAEGEEEVDPTQSAASSD